MLLLLLLLILLLLILLFVLVVAVVNINAVIVGVFVVDVNEEVFNVVVFFCKEFGQQNGLYSNSFNFYPHRSSTSALKTTTCSYSTQKSLHKTSTGSHGHHYNLSNYNTLVSRSFQR